MAIGGTLENRGKYHLDLLVQSIENFDDWKISLSDRQGFFDIDIEMDDVLDDESVQLVLEQVENILDFIAVSRQVGFKIQHYSASYKPEKGLSIHWGEQEYRLPSMNNIEKGIIRAIVQSKENTDILKARKCLNHCYIENTMPGRVSILWSGIEELFREEQPLPLLNIDEIKAIKKCIREIPSLATDRKRTDEFISAISDPQRMPLKSRNKIISEGISKKLDIPSDGVYKEIKKASTLRGKHVHELHNDWRELVECEKFLHSIIRNYLAKNPK